jgi:O-antigen ligase
MNNPDLLSALAAADRRSPGLAGWHATAAAGWAFFVPLSRSIEAGFFVALIAFAVLRFSAIHRCWWAALRTVPGVCFVAWILLVVTAGLLRQEPWSWSSSWPTRQFLIPLLLVPVIHRWRLLLAALSAGAIAASGVCLIESIGVLARGESLLEHQSRRGAFVLPIALLASVATLAGCGWIRRLAGTGATLVSVAALGTTTQRSMLVAAAAGLAAFAAMPRVSLAFRAAIAGVLVGGAILAATVSQWSGAAAVRFETLWATDGEDSRVGLWQVTLEESLHRPLIGHGLSAWRPAMEAARDECPTCHPVLAILDRRADLNYAHNTVIDLLFESGLLGTAILAFGAAWGVRRWFGRIASEPLAPLAMAMLLATFVGGQFDHLLARFIPAAITLLLATCTLLPRPDEAEFSRNGLGAEDDWVDRLLGTRAS